VAIERDPGQLKIGLSTGMWGTGGNDDREVAERVRTVGEPLDGSRGTRQPVDLRLGGLSPRGSTAHIAARIERARPEWSGAIRPVHVGTDNSGGTRN
jgi:hypothetical protein